MENEEDHDEEYQGILEATCVLGAVLRPSAIYRRVLSLAGEFKRYSTTSSCDDHDDGRGSCPNSATTATDLLKLSETVAARPGSWLKVAGGGKAEALTRSVECTHLFSYKKMARSVVRNGSLALAANGVGAFLAGGGGEERRRSRPQSPTIDFVTNEQMPASLMDRPE